MLDAWIDAVWAAARQLPAAWAVVMLAALPVIETRGAIPFGMALGLPAFQALVLASFGSILPVPFLLILLEPLGAWLQRQRWGRGFAAWLYRRGERHREQVMRYGWYGLVLFVAVPFPTTGAWTAALVASLLRMPRRPAFFAIALGSVFSGIIVTFLSMLGISVLLS